MDSVEPVASAEEGGSVESRFTDFCKVSEIFLFFSFSLNYLISRFNAGCVRNCLIFFGVD